MSERQHIAAAVVSTYVDHIKMVEYVMSSGEAKSCYEIRCREARVDGKYSEVALLRSLGTSRERDEFDILRSEEEWALVQHWPEGDTP